MASIARTTDGTLAFEPSHPDDPEAVVRELAMLLTDGRLNDESRRVIEEAYRRLHKLVDSQNALKTALKLFVLTAEFHATKYV